MAIDMNGLNPNQPGSSRSKGIGPPPASQKLDASAEKTEVVSEKRGESVSFSGKAKDFQQIEAGLKDSPGIDEGKVARIRAALEDGSYEISAERVAQKMLDMEKDIF